MCQPVFSEIDSLYFLQLNFAISTSGLRTIRKVTKNLGHPEEKILRAPVF